MSINVVFSLCDPPLTLLSVPVTPAGNPLKVTVTGAFSPPSSVVCAITELEPVWTIDNVEADNASCNPGACVTCRVICLVAVTPSPFAVTVIGVEPTGAVDPAVNVKVLLPLSAESVTGLLLQPAVTPAGRPLTLKLTAPVKVPFPASVTSSVPHLPCTMAAAAEEVVSESAGGVRVTVIGTVMVAE